MFWLWRTLLCFLLWWVIFWIITINVFQWGDQFIQHFFELLFKVFSSPSLPNLRPPQSHLDFWLLHDLKICNLGPSSLYSCCQKLYLFSGKTWQAYLSSPMLSSSLCTMPVYNSNLYKLLLCFTLFWSCHEHVRTFLWDSHKDSGYTFPA